MYQKRGKRRIVTCCPHAVIAVMICALRKTRARRMRKIKAHGLQSGGNGIRNSITTFYRHLEVAPLRESLLLRNIKNDPSKAFSNALELGMRQRTVSSSDCRVSQNVLTCQLKRAMMDT
jgi:hypothetical protein